MQTTSAPARGKNAGTKEYTCRVCGEVCTSEGWLGYHVRTIHKEAEEKAAHTGARNEQKRVIPASREHPIQVLLKCPNCGESTIVHMTTQQEPKTVKCEACDRIMSFGAWRMWAFCSPAMAPRPKRQREGS